MSSSAHLTIILLPPSLFFLIEEGLYLNRCVCAGGTSHANSPSLSSLVTADYSSRLLCILWKKVHFMIGFSSNMKTQDLPCDYFLFESL
uniref:Secreted protein n=1 Tax=Sparus aurata TaxID=8175 RepID=A0A671YXG1_SPAAU